MFTETSVLILAVFIPNTKSWDDHYIKNLFMGCDAKDILLYTTSQHHDVFNRVVWNNMKNGVCSVKFSYHFWHSLNANKYNVATSIKWNKIWNLGVPTK